MIYYETSVSRVIPNPHPGQQRAVPHTYIYIYIVQYEIRDFLTSQHLQKYNLTQCKQHCPASLIRSFSSLFTGKYKLLQLR